MANGSNGNIDAQLIASGGEDSPLLTTIFSDASSGNIASDPILLGVKEGTYYVHETSGFMGLNHDVNTYNEREFYQTHGDPSQMVTLSDYNKDLEGINPARDITMEKAADIYNNAVRLGFVKDGSEDVTETVEYDGKLNFGRLERELASNLNEYDGIPDAVTDQIKELIGQSRELSGAGSVMLTRANNIEKDVAEAGLSDAGFDGLQGSLRTFSRDGLIEFGGDIKPAEASPVTH